MSHLSSYLRNLEIEEQNKLRKQREGRKNKGNQWNWKQENKINDKSPAVWKGQKVHKSLARLSKQR